VRAAMDCSARRLICLHFMVLVLVLLGAPARRYQSMSEDDFDQSGQADAMPRQLASRQPETSS
jgi:hypothetical protein